MHVVADLNETFVHLIFQFIIIRASWVTLIFPSVPLACISAERRRQSSKNSRYNVVRLCLRLSNEFASSRLFFSTKRCICIRAASCIQCLLLRHPVTGEFHVDWVIVIKSIVIWMSISISKEELRVLFKKSWRIDDEITRASSHLWGECDNKCVKSPLKF